MPISNLFSKIRNMLKSKKENAHNADIQQNEIPEEVKISRGAAKNAKHFFVKYWPYFLIIIPIIIVIFVRYQSIGLTIADDWAEDNVRNFFRDQIKSQISQQYPDLPEANLEKITDEQFIKFAKENKKIIDEQIALNAEQYKDFFQYESGSHSYPYMGDIDSYYWLRQARNIVEKGYNCDVIENGVCYDTYTVAPGKIKLSKNMHPYSIAFFYKMIKPFNHDITLMQVQLIVPTIFAVITAILVYLMMLKPFGTLAAITSSVLISVNPLFLSRSIGSDNDIYNIVFPVLIIFLAFNCFNARGWKAKAILSAILGLSIATYSFAWIGWWYLFDFILAAILLDYAVSVAKEWVKSKKLAVNETIRSEKTREMLAVLVPFFLITIILVGIISSFSALKVTYSGFLSFTKTKVAANPNLWPNVLTTVAEFNEASISQVIENTGGKWFFFFALLGFIIIIYKTLRNIIKNRIIMLLSIGILYYLVTSKGIGLEPRAYIMIFSIPFVLGMYFSLKSEENIDIRFSVLFFLWSAASIYAATKGTRFILLIIPPMAIGIGITFGFLHKTMTSLLANSTKINKALVSIILFLAFSYYLVEPVESGISTSKNYLPNVNDQWWNALTKIKENSKPDAIINSWWDFGHWFKYIADRRVTLDGSSQNHPQLHWLGKLLLSSDEKETVGILRMLDCGGNRAFNYINNISNDTPKSIKVLNKVIPVEDRAQAKDILTKEGLSEEQSEKVSGYAHCEPPENFLITSEDMIGKSGVWAHFGSWDFDKSWMYSAFKSNDEAKAIKMFMDEFDHSEENAASYYSEIKELKSDSEVNAWIAPWPSYISQESCQRASNIIRCPFQQGFVEIDLDSMDASIPTSEGIKKPRIFSYTTPSGINVQEYHDNTIGLGMVLLINKDGSYSSIYMAPQLVNSTFTKLFYLDGHGTRYFDLFHESGGSNVDIKIWKVNWEGSDKPRIVERFNAQA